MGAQGGAGGVLQSGAMGPSEAVLLWLLLGVLGAAACGERCGNGLPPAPGPAAPRSWLRPRDPRPRFTTPAPSVPQSRTPCGTS